jgi:uncharacterized protein
MSIKATLNNDVKKCISKSVLCWLATSNENNVPNVSPKEMFTFQDDDTLLIAHLASPNTINNIKVNPYVCVSFIDVFVQKGYKLKGIAQIVDKTDLCFSEKVKPIIDLFTNKFPIMAVIEIKISSVAPIIAPSYFLYKETTEEGQIASAMETYQVRPK